MSKHFTRTTSFIAAALLAATASAQGQTLPVARQYAPARKAAAAKAAPRKAAKLPARTLPIATDKVVEEQPEGTLYANQAYRNTYHYYNWDGEIENAKSEAILTDYVMAPDGTIWLKSPISLTESGWVRLDMVEEDFYVAHTPQLIMEYEDDVDEYGNPYRAYATRLVLRNDGDGYYYYPDGTSDEGYNLDMKFSYVDGVLHQIEDSCVAEMDNMPYEVLGLTYADGDWLGFASANIHIYPIQETTACPPEGVARELYAVTATQLSETTGEPATTQQLAQMAFSGNDAWLATPGGTGGWMHGTKHDDGSIVFGPQYLGPCKELGTHLWFMPADYTLLETGSEWEPYELQLDRCDDIRLAPDGNGGYAAQEGKAIVTNAAAEKVLYVNTFLSPAVAPFEEVAAKPATPDVWEYYPYDSEWGFGLFSAIIPTTDTEGQIINSEKLSYVIYLGDENHLLTLSPSKYCYLDHEMTELPYHFTDNFDISLTEMGHTVYLFSDGYDRVGVQSIYRGAGEERRSDIGWSDGEVTDGIAPAATNATAAPAARYDLQGRRISKPTRGISIVRMADGTVRKQVIR